MGPKIDIKARRELVRVVGARYRKGTRQEKPRILYANVSPLRMTDRIQTG